MTIIVALMGACVGLAGYTFYYAHGTSYLSNDPRACANCHVMQEQLDGWQKSSHHAVATCNDCHVPHDFFGKYLSKMANGYHHSKAFTLQDYHDPIFIKERNARILEDNCIQCHATLVQDIVGHGTDRGRPDCVRCHGDVGHGIARK